MSEGVPAMMPGRRKGRWAEARGNALVEFAVIAPLLVAILVPTIDLGMGFYCKVQVTTAAQAGAQYAFNNGWNSAKISGAVTSATGLSSISVPTGYPREVCGCADGTQITGQTTPPCSGKPCTDAKGKAIAAGTYVFVQAQATYTPLLSYLSFGNPITMSSQSVVRIK